MGKILVTGDKGYIGSSLVPYLLKKNYKVLGLDTNFFKTKIDGKVIRYPHINKDIRNIGKEDLTGVDTIVHLAALSNDPMGSLSPILTEEINYKASVKLARLAKESGVKRFIFSSSCSIYGRAGNRIVDEKSKIDPVTEYAKSKIKTEKELVNISDDKFTVGIMRNPTVFGFSPNFRCDLVVNDLLVSALLDKKIIVLSDGTPWRPLIEIRDLIQMFELFIKADPHLINGQIFNVGFSQSNYQVKDIAKALSKILALDIYYSEKKNNDQRSYKVDFGKFKKSFPKASQAWSVDKSVKDLASKLKPLIKQNKFHKEDYIRLAQLQSLLDRGKLDRNLYWL